MIDKLSELHHLDTTLIPLFGSKYSRIDQLRFVEGSLYSFGQGPRQSKPLGLSRHLGTRRALKYSGNWAFETLEALYSANS